MYKLYYNNDLLDFNGTPVIRHNAFDIRDQDIGSSSKSYDLEIPLTETNKKLLGVPGNIASVVTLTGVMRLYMDGALMIKGLFRVFKINRYLITGIIEAVEWTNGLDSKSLRALGWAAGDKHVFSDAAVRDSWTPATSLYRYPLINFGKLWSLMTGASAELMPWDFVPMWNVQDIIEKIFSELEYSLDASNFFTSDTGKNLYIMGSEPVNESGFASGKSFQSNVTSDGDNIDTISHTSGDTLLIEFYHTLQFLTTVLDEGGYFTSSYFTAPASGSYRFKTSFKIKCTHNIEARFTGETQNYTINIYNTAKVEVIQEISGTAGVFFDGVTSYEIDTGYVYLDAGDTVEVRFTGDSTALNTGATMDASIWVEYGTTSYFKNYHDKRNIYKGFGYEVSPATFLPDVTCLEFLKALKELFGLRFWVDQLKRVVYILPSDEFITGNVIDWSGLEDYSRDIDHEIIAANYKKVQILKYKNDSGDKALQDNIILNGFPYQKTITLTNTNAQDGIETRENSLFAPTVEKTWTEVSGSVPAIFDSFDYPDNEPDNRLTRWEPRLLLWDGATAKNWEYRPNYLEAAESLITYPKASCIDIATLFSTYYQKYWHYIDKAKLIKVNIIIDASKLAQFITVLNSGSTEAFRATYKQTIEGSPMSFVLNSIETNGKKAKCEFIQKI